MVLDVLVYFSSFIIGVVLGGLATFLSRRMLVNRQIRIAERKAARLVAEARLESKDILHTASQEADKIKAATEADYRERRSDLQRQENRLSQKTESLERKLEGVDQRDRNLANKEKEIDSVRSHLEETKNKQLKQLELISGLSSSEAKQIILERVDGEFGRAIKFGT